MALDVMRPTPVNVRPLEEGEKGANWGSTALFRESSCLPHVLELAHAFVDEPKDLSVVSAGCSFGAEVDSVLALCNKDERFEHVSIHGLDIEAFFIRAAKLGLYAAFMSKEELVELAPELESMGFGCDRDIHAEAMFPHDDWTESRVLIESEIVRRGHDVSFNVCDLSGDKVAPTKPADLLICNNLFYYLGLSGQAPLAANLDRLAGEECVLSLGEFNLHNQALDVLSEHLNNYGFYPLPAGARKDLPESLRVYVRG